MAEEERRDTFIDHPNRKKPAAKVTKVIVILLLLVSVGLMAFVTIGGWSALEGAKQALRAGDPGTIRKALDELNSAYSSAGASLYQGAQGQGQPGPEAAGGQAEPSGQGGPEDVVEADYEIVDDKK